MKITLENSQLVLGYALNLENIKQVLKDTGFDLWVTKKDQPEHLGLIIALEWDGSAKAFRKIKEYFNDQHIEEFLTERNISQYVDLIDGELVVTRSSDAASGTGVIKKGSFIFLTSQNTKILFSTDGNTHKQKHIKLNEIQIEMFLDYLTGIATNLYLLDSLKQNLGEN